MTRSADKDVSYPDSSDGEELGARCAVANDANVDVFVSVHCNSFTDTAAVGTETFHAPGSTKGVHLAACIQEKMLGALQRPDRGVKEEAHYVTIHTGAPACLVELAFISNEDEAKILASPEKQRAAAEAIVAGIKECVG
jgi:N-acetylmuramoyl-L-alanine amidase